MLTKPLHVRKSWHISNQIAFTIGYIRLDRSHLDPSTIMKYAMKFLIFWLIPETALIRFNVSFPPQQTYVFLILSVILSCIGIFLVRFSCFYRDRFQLTYSFQIVLFSQQRDGR